MSSRKKAHVVRRNGRLGVEVSQAPLLPPIHPSPALHAPLAQQQQQELLALRDAFRERLRTNAKLDDLEPLLRFATTALAATTPQTRPSERDAASADNSRVVIDQQTDRATEADSAESDDCFGLLQRLAALLAPVHPFAAQFVDSLTAKIHELVRERLHAEAAVNSAHSPSSGITSPRTRHVAAGDVDSVGAAGANPEAVHSDSSSSDEDASGASSLSGDETAVDKDGATDNGSDDNDGDNARGGATGACVSPRTHGVMTPRGNTFRHSLRCRVFPPTRVPESEYVSTTCAYTPFDHSRTTSDLASIHLEANNESKTSHWRVVQFPKPKPSVSRVETDALVQWAQSKLVVCHSEAPREPAEYALKRRHFQRSLALFELICYELTRLVFDRCPTTARFVHGLFVELVDTALRTVANADRNAQITEQRQRNVQLELQQLTAKLDSVRASLASLEETLRKRQRHLLSERERIIWQRKRLNVLLCADQVLIRSVAALIQHLLDLSDELLTALVVDDPHGLLGSQLAHVLRTSSSGVSNGSDDDVSGQHFALVDELYELVKSKYTDLREVHETVTRVEKVRTDREGLEAEMSLLSATAHSGRVVVLDVDKVATATEDFKSALRRIQRLVSTKSPDSVVGWEPQELWDQALFIPPPEDIQDLDRDVLRLCKHVEAHVLRRRHETHGLCHDAAVQTDISACVSYHPRSRANGFISFPTSFTFEPEPGTGRDTAGHTHPSDASTASAHEDAAAQHLREEHRELLERFLPPALRRYVRAIPRDYAPRQLSLGVVHAIISYLYNEMWLLVRDAYVQQPKRFAATVTGRHAIPVASIHEYIYRIYVAHFRDPAFTTSRLLDLLVSASRLDTQSCKVLLFCRLLHLPGVDPLAHDAFWFALKTMHVLQRACASTGHYYHLDASGENEFIPQASATEALTILFRGAPNDVMKRLRLRLAGLASVYGAIWIPASNIIELAMDEWKTAQDALRMGIQEKIAVEHRSARVEGMTPIPDNHVPSFASFLAVFSDLHLKVHRLEAAQAYRQLLLSAKQTRHHGAGNVTIVNPEHFRQQWTELIVHAVNQAQQQQHVPSAQQHHVGTSGGTASGRSASASLGIHFGAPADAFVAANRHLSCCFLRATWQQTKNDFIRWLDVAFHDIGLQVRLIQQMDAIVAQEDAAAQVGWRSFQQLVQITAMGKIDVR